MLKQLRPAVMSLLLLTIVTGVLYPAIVTAIAQVCFHHKANGSILPNSAGCALIGQPFDDPKFFWPRLSATTDADGKPLPYNAANSSGSNLGPTNTALADAATARLAALRAADPKSPSAVPVDLATASASVLDPHISPAAAEFQVHRVATARHLEESKVRDLVTSFTENRQLGFLGEPRVNVLLLNLALERLNP